MSVCLSFCLNSKLGCVLCHFHFVHQQESGFSCCYCSCVQPFTVRDFFCQHRFYLSWKLLTANFVYECFPCLCSDLQTLFWIMRRVLVEDAKCHVKSVEFVNNYSNNLIDTFSLVPASYIFESIATENPHMEQLSWSVLMGSGLQI